MAFNLDSAWKVAQTIFGIADVSRRMLNPSEAIAPARPVPTSRAPAGGLLGHVEARLTGVVISALKEAFDRDAARLDAERAALDDQRRRAEEALRLELVRQAADRALDAAAGGRRARADDLDCLGARSLMAGLAASSGLGGSGRAVLACGWAGAARGHGRSVCRPWTGVALGRRRPGQPRNRRRSPRERPVARGALAGARGSGAGRRQRADGARRTRSSEPSAGTRVLAADAICGRSAAASGADNHRIARSPRSVVE